MNHHAPKVPLSNPKLERILIGGLVLSNHAYWSMQGVIRASSFVLPLHQQMFTIIAEMVEAGTPTTVPVLCAKLPEDAEDERGQTISVRSYLTACIEQATGLSPQDVYDEIAELAAKRQIVRLANDALKAVEKGKFADEIAGELEMGAVDVAHATSPARPKKLSEIGRAVIAKARAAKDTGSVPGSHTGLATLDRLVGLLMPGDLGAILAAQSDGKSLLARHIAKHVSQYRPVLEIQMEMGDEQLVARDIAAISGVPISEIQEGRVDAFDFEKVEAAQDVLNTYNYEILKQPEMTLRQIKAMAMAKKRTSGLGLLIIDQLDKITLDHRAANKWDRGVEVTKGLKALALELDVPTIVIAQRTRMAQRHESEVPRVNDSEFPSLEKDVDWLLGLWRRETWLQQFEPSRDDMLKHDKWKEKMAAAAGRASVIVLKRRSGKRFVTADLGWDGPTMRVWDL